MQTDVVVSTAYHLETDGQTERVNRVVEDMLRHYIGPRQDDWYRYLDMAEFAINNAFHESTQTTSFYLNTSQHPLLPLTVDLESIVPAAGTFVERLHKSVKLAKSCLEAAQQRQKMYADPKRRDVKHYVGELVLLSSKHLHIKSTGTRKLLPKWIEPFPITHLVGKAAVRLELPSTICMCMHNVFHVSLVKPFHSNGSHEPLFPIMSEDGTQELFI